MARIREEEKIRIRQSILDESKAMFLELGYDGTSTKKIAKAVGIAEGTIFNYFKTKAEIYLEVMVAEYAGQAEASQEVLLNKEVSAVICEKVMTDVGFILKLPRKVILEIASVLLSLSKSRPELINELIAMDFRFLASLQVFVESLLNKKLLIGVDAKDLSEIIYSLVAFEIMMFYYDKSAKKETILVNVKRKLETVLKGYVEV